MKRNSIFEMSSDQISGINGPQNVRALVVGEVNAFSMFNSGRGIHDRPINHKDSTIVTHSLNGQYCVILRYRFSNLSLRLNPRRAEKA